MAIFRRLQYNIIKFHIRLEGNNFNVQLVVLVAEAVYGPFLSVPIQRNAHQDRYIRIFGRERDCYS